MCMPSILIPRLVGPWDGRRVAWTSSVSLTRFEWAVQYGVGVGNEHRADCSRAAVDPEAEYLDRKGRGPLFPAKRR